MAHIKVALKCVTPSNEYKKKQKNKNMNIKEVSTIKCCWDLSFHTVIEWKKILSNNTKLLALSEGFLFYYPLFPSLKHYIKTQND